MPGRTRPPGRNPDAFPDRIQVLAPEGSVLLGPSRIDVIDTRSMVERRVPANGQVVALARMRPAHPADGR